MANTDLIVTNTTISSVDWGGLTLAASGTYTVQEVDRVRFLNDDTFRTALTAGDATVNNAYKTLDEGQAVRALSNVYQTEIFVFSSQGLVEDGSYLRRDGHPSNLVSIIIEKDGIISFLTVTCATTQTFDATFYVNDVLESTVSLTNQSHNTLALTKLVETNDTIYVKIENGTADRPVLQMSSRIF